MLRKSSHRSVPFYTGGVGPRKRSEGSVVRQKRGLNKWNTRTDFDWDPQKS